MISSYTTRECGPSMRLFVNEPYEKEGPAFGGDERLLDGSAGLPSLLFPIEPVSHHMYKKARS